MRGFAAQLHVALVASALAASVLGCGERAQELPRVASLPEFELLDQDGEPFRTADLHGKVTIANFIFTNCPTICPLLTQRTLLLQNRFAHVRDRLQIVSFSVDPRNDTPEALKAYGQRYHVDTRMWTMVTGPIEDVNQVVVRGFNLSIGEAEERDDGTYDIMHSSHFVLIDREGVIRGYYASDEDGMVALVADIERLMS